MSKVQQKTAQRRHIALLTVFCRQLSGKASFFRIHIDSAVELGRELRYETFFHRMSSQRHSLIVWHKRHVYYLCRDAESHIGAFFAESVGDIGFHFMGSVYRHFFFENQIKGFSVKEREGLCERLIVQSQSQICAVFRQADRYCSADSQPDSGSVGGPLTVFDKAPFHIQSHFRFFVLQNGDILTLFSRLRSHVGYDGLYRKAAVFSYHR